MLGGADERDGGQERLVELGVSGGGDVTDGGGKSKSEKKWANVCLFTEGTGAVLREKKSE